MYLLKVNLLLIVSVKHLGVRAGWKDVEEQSILFLLLNIIIN